MMRRLVLLALVAVPVAGSDVFVTSAEACPMCKEANETDEVAAARPRAYMYSILFMLAMPMMVFGGIGLNFYRMVRKADREWEALQSATPSDDGSGEPLEA